VKKLILAVLIVSTSLLSLSCLSVFGASEPQQKSSSSKNSAQNSLANDSALLAQLSLRSKAIQSLQGHFVQQKHISVLPVPLNSTGKFAFEQAKGVIWETLTPVHNAVHLTPKGITFEDEKGQSQNPAAKQAGVEVVAKIFMGVITGELDGLNNYFLVSASGSEKQWKLLLSPRSANLAAYIQSIELQGGEFTEQLDIAETNGDKTHIAFTTDKVVRKAQ
jgi:hypothetical protein